MFCPKCGKENKDNVKFCVHCGTRLAISYPKKSRSLLAAVILTVLAVLALATWQFMPSLTKKANSKTEEKQTADIGSQSIESRENDTNPQTAVNNADQANRTNETNKPDVKLFVMSYCPYGLRMEKAYLPVYDLLKNKANIGIYFVNYSMHGKKEIDENLRQYCIERDQNDKYPAYLNCFISNIPWDINDPSSYSRLGKDSVVDYSKCFAQAGIDNAILDNCIAETDKQFNVTADYNDKSKWLEGAYPRFEVTDQLNKEYGINGSPWLVIINVNGKNVDGTGNDVSITSEGMKQWICKAFDEQPQECQTKLSN